MFFQRKHILVFVYSLLLSILNANPGVDASCGHCYVPREGAADARKAGEISSGPMVNSPTASTLGKNRVAGGFTFGYLNFNSIPAENAHGLYHAGRDVHGKRHEETYDLHAGYGMTDGWDVYLSAPVVSKTSAQIHSHRALGQAETATGFGDMRLVTKLRFWKKILEAALIGGIKFPTGKTSALDSTDAKFEAEQQPGSGSWDGEFGVVISRSFLSHFSLASSFQYALHGKGAQEHRLGDLFIYSVGASAALRALGEHPNLSVVVEFNNKWARRDDSREEKRVFDSGGMTMFVTPGLVAGLTKNLSAFFGMPIPVFQNLGGEHEELNLEMLAGVNFHF